VAELARVGLNDVQLARGCSLALLIENTCLLACTAAPEPRSATRVVVRRLLGKLTSRAPDSLRFGQTRYGKPYLAELDPIAFSISHSRAHTLIAISLCGAVGCDTEDRFGSDDVHELSPSILHAAERDAMGRLTKQQKMDAFMRYWVRKEAVVKAEGSGFLRDPRAIIVGLDDAQAKWIGQEGRPLNLHNEPVEARCLAAVASMDSACAWYVYEL